MFVELEREGEKILGGKEKRREEEETRYFFSYFTKRWPNYREIH